LAFALAQLNATKAIGLLRDLSHKQQMRSVALRTLCNLPARVVIPEVKRLLKDDDEGVRGEAMNALSRLTGRESIPDIIPFMESSFPGIRIHAIQTLATFGVPAALNPMRELIKSGHMDSISYSGNLDMREFGPDLLAIVRNRESAQFPAAYILAANGGESLIKALLPLLMNAPPSTRFAAGAGFAAVWSKEALPLLLPLLKTPEEAKGDVPLALGYLGVPESAEELLVASHGNLPQGGHTAIWSLGRTGVRKMIPYLISLLDHEDWNRRSEAVTALEDIDAVEALPLIRVLLSDDSLEVRIRAAAWITRTGSEEGVPLLLSKGRNLFALNALREPRLWKKLQEVRFSKPIRGERLIGIEEVTRAAGMRMQIREDYTGEYPYPSPGARNVIEALEVTCAVLDDDRVLILPEHQALTFWRQWWESRKKK
jgi:HEAT repeat protein